jgi:hypothetical protein
MHRRVRARLVLLFLAVPASLAAQAGAPDVVGVIESDFRAVPAAFAPSESDPLDADEKSVPLAGALSALLPGAGQIYAEAPWWRTALYVGVEALGWTAYAVTSSRGTELTSEFESFADEHWSVVRYIEWLAANYTRWDDSAVNKEVARDALARIYTSSDQTRPDWERVDFAQLNRLESAVRGGFSHTLPHHGHQQYYEEIGKYVQYRAGWSDHVAEGDTMIYDPSRVTRRNDAYMEQRADANDYLGYASTALGGIIVNHLASLLDAALTARSYNARIRAELKGSLVPDDARPLNAAVTLTVRF